MFLLFYCRPAKSTAPSTTSTAKPKKEDRQWVGVVRGNEAKELDYSGASPPLSNGTDHDDDMDVCCSHDSRVIYCHDHFL